MLSEREHKSANDGVSKLRQAINGCEPIFILPKDDAANNVISPALASCEEVDVMIGFFSSQALSEIAPGLAAFLRNSAEPMRLVVSPYLTNEDREALSAGTMHADALVEGKWAEGLPTADDLARHTLSCLGWLTSQGRLRIQVALMRNALFHPKVWLFRGADDVAALHGSANMTDAGLGKNREQLSLARAWMGEDATKTCKKLSDEFESLWGGGDDDCLVVDMPRAIQEKLVKEYRSDRMPDEDDFRRLWRKAQGLPETTVIDKIDVSASPEPEFTIPAWLDYRSGDYAHQGQAVDSWRNAGWRGVLEMCTGSGKTLTAMVGAYHLYQEVGPLLIVIAAPYRVLVQQWANEVALFGLQPVDLTAETGPKGRERAIGTARRRLRLKVSPTEAVLVTNATLCSQEFIDQVAKHDGPKLLIADECHNLGAEGFMNDPPEIFDYRLGLSATPVRQYDAEGTQRLFDYFGEPCFSFLLEHAIGRCLTPYDYFAHFVHLSEEEMEEWRLITEKISKLAWKIDAGIKDEQLEGLLLKRRRVLETAQEKVRLLAALLDDEDAASLRYTLIYATDKDPRQLDAVNAILNERHLLFHQLTSEETVSRDLTRQIVSGFQSGRLQILTAKRVLDEGVNIPEIMRAFILASTTVRRQWVQRRGRLLRTCKAIGKTHAVIHDFVALPPMAREAGELDRDAKRIVNAELDRVWEFARLSRNGAASGGPFTKVEELRTMLKGG